MAQIEVQPGSNITVTVNKGPLSGGLPAGSVGDLQYNVDGQRFGAIDGITYDAANATTTLGSGGTIVFSGGALGQTLTNMGDGVVGWSQQYNIANGTTSVTTNASNVAITAGFTANVAVIDSSGITVKGHILPEANVTYDLGSSTQRWRDLYLSNATIDLNGTRISADEAGTLVTSSGLLVQGGIQARNFYGNISGDYLKGDGSEIFNINGANVSGAVSVSITSGVADTVREGYQPNITHVGTLSTLRVEGPTDLGDIGNITVSGGGANLFATSEANGQLKWSEVRLSNIANGSTTFRADQHQANITVDGVQLYVGTATTNRFLKPVVLDNTLEVTGNANLANTVITRANIANLTVTGRTTLGSNANVKISGGAIGEFLQTDSLGNLSWATPTKLVNGGSSLIIDSNGYSRFQVGGVADVLKVTEDGIITLASGDSNFGNSVTANYINGNIVASHANLGNVGNVKIYGGSNSYILATDGAGNLRWTQSNIVNAATVEYVDGAVANAVTSLIDGAPEALDTFLELANAIANDASYATTIVNSLANKVEFTTYETYVNDTANTIANLVTTSTYQTYVDDTANVIANLATSANLQTLADTTANAIANKVETADFQSYVDTTANTIANLVTVDTFTTYQGDVANTVANLATISYVDTSVSNAVANVLGGAPEVLDTLSELANALGNDASFITTITSGLANKVETTTYDLFVSDTGNTIANLVTTDTFTQYQGDVANAFANTASFQELEDGLANKVYSNVFNDTVANLVTTTTFNDTVANLATITYVDNSIANIPSVDLTPYATITYVDDSIANIPAVDLTPYATITYVDDSIANIPPTDLSAYSTTTEVNGLISTALSGHGNIVSVNLSGNTSQLLAGDGTWIDRITLSGANAVSISVTANGAGQSFQDNEFIHYTGNVKPMLFKNGVFVDLGEYSIASNSITFTNNLTVGDQIDVMPTQIAVVSGGGGSVDLSNYATHQDVADAINLIPSPNLDAYATNTSVDNKIANIPQPNLSAYATNTSVDNKIANITFPTYGNVANINLNGNASTYLAGNGTWQAVSGGGTTSPAGVNTQIQFNNNGAFGASANLTFADNGLVIGNIASTKITLNKFGAVDAKTVNARDGFTTTVASAGELTVNRLIASLTDAPPTSSTDFGTFGEIRYDSNFLYICVAENTWSRTALNTTW